MAKHFEKRLYSLVHGRRGWDPFISNVDTDFQRSGKFLLGGGFGETVKTLAVYHSFLDGRCGCKACLSLLIRGRWVRKPQHIAKRMTTELSSSLQIDIQR